MPTEPDDEQQKLEAAEPFCGVRKFVDNTNVPGLMRELKKVPTETQVAILNKLSISDDNGGCIELDRTGMIPMPDSIRRRAEEDLKRRISQNGVMLLEPDCCYCRCCFSFLVNRCM